MNLLNFKRPHLKYGLLYGTTLGIIVVGIGVIRYKTGMILKDDHTLSYVFWCIFTLAIIHAIFQYKRQDSVSFTNKRAIFIGLIAGLICGLMYTCYIFILNNYLDPELSAKIIEFFKEQSINSEISKNDAKDSIKIMRMNPTLRGLIYTIVCMIFGVIHSLTGIFIVKRLNSPNQ